MDEARLQKLISASVDDSIGQEEKSELLAALREDVRARQTYLSYMSVHAELCSLESTENYLVSINTPNADTLLQKPTYSSRYWKYIAIAASLLLLTGVWQSVSSWQNNNLATSVAKAQILNTIEPLSEECEWYVEQSNRTHAKSYLPGDVIRVTEGKLELTYSHGTKVVLHSPAAYQLLSGMEARMIVGRLTATVAEAAKGFSVLIPRATVVDLGTQFGVKVSNDGASDVVVFEGEVDVDYDNNSDNIRDQRLTMGEAVHLDAAGTPSRIVSINGHFYSNVNLAELSRSAVIAEVQDNINRDAAMLNYYEIVQQGMQEDALAFVDRIAHQWNGMDSEGIPSYLLGADYVKTFNSDKYNQGIEVSITLTVPCKLYVFFDDRLAIPSWLREEFKDTGDDIGLDVGPYFSHDEWHNRKPPGVGPGDSVDDVLSVWVKEIPEPCVYLLHATEVSLGDSITNMYGIAAAPLDSPSVKLYE